MKKITLLLALLVASISFGQVVINEVDADQTGTDTGEFIELLGAPNTSLNGLVVVLFNGSDDQSYAAYDLSGSTDANGFYVLGTDTVTGVDLIMGTDNTIQNGADAIAVYTGSAADWPNDSPISTTNLIDVIVYDTSDGDDSGLLTGFGETTQYDENANGTKDTDSLQRDTDGTYCTAVPTLRAESDCTVDGPTEVATIAALRASTEGMAYTLTGEAVLTFQQDFRNQKFIEDATAAILIDDNPGVITSAYNLGDGITSITGTLGSFNGMLQFIPTEDPGAASSTGNAVTPQIVSIADLNAAPNDYESEYVTVEMVAIDNTPSTNWENGLEYPISNTDGNYMFRVTFFDVDYVGQPVPAEATISGIINERNNGEYFITARNAADIESTSTCPLLLGTIETTCDSETDGQDSTTTTIAYTGGGTENYVITVTGGGTIAGDDPSTVAEGTILLENVSEASTVTLSITSASCDISQDITTPSCNAPLVAANLAELRAGTLGEEYTLTGEAVLTFQQDFRNQKFIEDATAGILIDDNPGVVTTTYAVGDGLTGIKGILSDFNGMLQFSPVEDPGAATSTGNAIEAQTVTAAELTANPNDYESEYVEIEQVFIDNTVPNWETGQEYALTTPTGDYIFRTSFFDADYIGQAVPTVESNVAGIITERNNGDFFITAREASDISEFLSVGENTIQGLSIYPNPASTFVSIQGTSTAQKEVEIFDITGKKVLSTTVNTTLDVSNLAPGLYVLQITQDNAPAVAKLIIK